MNRRPWITLSFVMAACGVALYVAIGEHGTESAIVTPKVATLDEVLRQPVTPELPSESPPLNKSPSAFKYYDEGLLSPWIESLVAALIERGDAESFIAAALLVVQPSFSKQSEQSVRRGLDLLNRAAMLDANNALAPFIALMVCGERKGCDTRPYEQALRFAAPRNAYGWMGEFVRSADKSDVQRSALNGIAERERFDFYAMPIHALLDRNVRSVRVPPPADGTAEKLTGYSPLEFLIGSTASLAVPLPKLKPMLDFCRAAEEAREPCLKIMEHMRNSDDYFAQAVGINIGMKLVPADSDLGKKLATAKNRMEWLTYQYSELKPLNAQISRLHAGTNGEVKVWEAVLRENGIPLTPPEGWARPQRY